MDLYCDNRGNFNDPNEPHKIGPMEFAPSDATFTGRSEASCLRQARAAGWKIGKTRHVCPHCNNKARSE